MVFESIVAELLNKVLGEYIQNLDYSQLKLSLWGGKHLRIVWNYFDISCIYARIYGNRKAKGTSIYLEVQLRPGNLEKSDAIDSGW